MNSGQMLRNVQPCVFALPLCALSAARVAHYHLIYRGSRSLVVSSGMSFLSQLSSNIWRMYTTQVKYARRGITLRSLALDFDDHLASEGLRRFPRVDCSCPTFPIPLTDKVIADLKEMEVAIEGAAEPDPVLRGHPRCEHGSRISSLHAAAHLLQPIAITSRGL